MSWARLDDNFHDHRKVVGLDVAAVGLYVLCLTWAHRHTRGKADQGIVPAGVAKRFGGGKTARLTSELVTAGLWHEVDGGWSIHDFATYLPADKTREARSAAGKRGAAKRWNGRKQTDAGDAQTDSNLPLDSHDVATDTDDNPIANNGSRADAHRVVLRTTTPEPAPVPTTSGELSPAAPSSQTLVAEWIEACGGVVPPRSVKGQVASQVKALLTEGIPYADVRAGLIAWHEKRLHPSTLASVVHETRLGPRTVAPSARPSTTDAAVANGAALVAKFTALEAQNVRGEIA